MRLPTRPHRTPPAGGRRGDDVLPVMLGILVALFSFLAVFLLSLP